MGYSYLAIRFFTEVVLHRPVALKGCRLRSLLWYAPWERSQMHHALLFRYSNAVLRFRFRVLFAHVRPARGTLGKRLACVCVCVLSHALTGFYCVHEMCKHNTSYNKVAQCCQLHLHDVSYLRCPVGFGEKYLLQLGRYSKTTKWHLL